MTVLLAPQGMAQENTATASKPIFVTPYMPSVPTYSSGIPAVVKNKNTGQRRSTPLRTNSTSKATGPQYDAPYNPYAAAGYGRIKSEKDFYDKQTSKYYKQYDYFALLAQRGDTQTLASAVKDVQQNGIFDPAKYNETMRAALNNTQTSAGNGGTIPPINQSANGNTRKVIVRDQQPVLPQKVHQGYDNEPDTAITTRPEQRKNAPIFLR